MKLAHKDPASNYTPFRDLPDVSITVCRQVASDDTEDSKYNVIQQIPTPRYERTNMTRSLTISFFYNQHTLISVWARTTLPPGRAKIAKLRRTSTLDMVASHVEFHHSIAVRAVLPFLFGSEPFESDIGCCILTRSIRMGRLLASCASMK